MLIECGLPLQDIDLIHCRGSEMGKLLAAAKDHIRLVQFTGSSEVADEISSLVDGAVRIEDAGFDWKIIGPDYQPKWLDYVAWQSDQDAYNATGQKCSAQSLLLIHKNWSKALLPKIKDLASQRTLDNLTIGPVLSLTNSEMLFHVNSLLEIKGTKLLFGGNEITGHTIPDCYGIIEPTAIQVPLDAFDSEYFDLITKELFGPFQIVVEYEDKNLEIVLEIIERISNHLTAAIVSQDIQFQQRIIGASVNGTTYCGMRARTTGAPQNHWFGPSGDPRAAGIGTPEAIIATWSCHREIIMDQGPLPNDWSIQ
jgi:1-pyrroline-5-carboxylate dehydrogenase